jgi:hypothetical protein
MTLYVVWVTGTALGFLEAVAKLYKVSVSTIIYRARAGTGRVMLDFTGTVCYTGNRWVVFNE